MWGPEKLPWADDPVGLPSFVGLRAQRRTESVPWQWEGADTWTAPRSSEVSYLGHGESGVVPAASDPLDVDWVTLLDGAPYATVRFATLGPLWYDRANAPVKEYVIAAPTWVLALDFPGDPNYGDPGFIIGKVVIDIDLGPTYPYPWMELPLPDWIVAGYLGDGTLAPRYGPIPYHDAHGENAGVETLGDTGWMPNPSPPVEFAGDSAGGVLWTLAQLEALSPRWVRRVGFVDNDLTSTFFGLQDGTVALNGFTEVIVTAYSAGRDGVLSIGDAAGGIRRRKNIVGSPSEPLVIA